MAFFEDFFLFRWMRDIKARFEAMADKPGSQATLFIMSLTEAIFFPIPPDALLIPMAFSFPKKALRFAFICTVASIIGAVIGYEIGFLASDWGHWLIDKFDPNKKVFFLIQEWFTEYGFWGVMLAAITPIPFKVFTVTSGIFGFSFPTFILASIVGRAFRFFLVAGLFYFFGKQIKPFIDKYFELLVVVFSILLVGGFLVLKFLK